MTVDGPGGRRWRREFDGRPMSPGGRPLDYRGSDGWGYRILSKSLAAGLFLILILCVLYVTCYWCRG